MHAIFHCNYSASKGADDNVNASPHSSYQKARYSSKVQASSYCKAKGIVHYTCNIANHIEITIVEVIVIKHTGSRFRNIRIWHYLKLLAAHTGKHPHLQLRRLIQIHIHMTRRHTEPIKLIGMQQLTICHMARLSSLFSLSPFCQILLPVKLYSRRDPNRTS